MKKSGNMQKMQKVKLLQLHDYPYGQYFVCINRVLVSDSKYLILTCDIHWCIHPATLQCGAYLVLFFLTIGKYTVEFNE